MTSWSFVLTVVINILFYYFIPVLLRLLHDGIYSVSLTVIMFQTLPKVTHPVYCKSMEKIVVSCTSISGQRRVRTTCLWFADKICKFWTPVINLEWLQLETSNWYTVRPWMRNIPKWRCEFWNPFHKFGKDVTRNFKFGTQIDLGISHLKDVVRVPGPNLSNRIL